VRLETEGGGTARPHEGDERRRAAVSYAQHGGAAGGAAVPMEAGGGSRWRDESGPSDEMG
jgi:hypothetical protein